MADIPGDPATTVSVNVDDELFSKIDKSGDGDFIAITLVAGQRYYFDLASAAPCGSVSFNPLLSLFDADGNLLASNDDVGEELNLPREESTSPRQRARRDDPYPGRSADHSLRAVNAMRRPGA